MSTATVKTVRQLALEHPTAPAVLEKLGIDYCCGGNVPFEQACTQAGHRPESVTELLAEAAAARQPGMAKDWQREPLTELIAHIEQTHHQFVRAETPRLLELARKVAAKHSGRKELADMYEVLAALVEELRVHLMKEEQILFPYIVRAEESAVERVPAPPSACFGSIENPIRMMTAEHDNAGEALRKLRELSGNYLPPADACTSYRALFSGLEAFEADLHRHIHLENNILFPRAIELVS